MPLVMGTPNPGFLKGKGPHSPLTLQHVLYGSTSNHVVVALVPLVSVLPDICRVVARIKVPHMVHHGK